MNPLRLLKNKFLRDAATLQIGAGLNTVSNFLSSVALAHVLGARLQGVYVIALGLYSLFFSLINVGVHQATVSQVAAASARGLEDKVASWLAFLAKAHLVFGGLLLVTGYFVLPVLAEQIYDDRRLGVLAWWLSVGPFLEMPRVVCQAAFQGTRRMLALAQVENGTEVVRLFLVVTGAVITGGPEGPIVGVVATGGVGSILGMSLYRRARRDGSYPLPGFRDIAARVRQVPLRHGLPLGIRLGVMRNVDALSMNVLPPLIAGWAGGTEWATYFRIGQKIMNLPMMAMQGVSRTALPVLSELAGLRDLARFRRVYLKVTLLSGGIISAGILIGLPLIHQAVALFYPAGYLDPVWSICLILVVGYVMASFAVALDSFYIVTDQLKAGVKITVLGLLVTIPVTFLLATWIPGTGVAWGMVCIMGWGPVHYAYVAWYFRTHRSFGVPAAAPEVGPGARPA